MIHIQGIDHVAFNVRDLDKSLEFYTKVIGLKVTEREPSKPGIEYFLDCGPSLLGIIQAKDLGNSHLFANEGLGANHFSFRVQARDFEPMIAHLEKHHVKIEFAKKRDSNRPGENHPLRQCAARRCWKRANARQSRALGHGRESLAGSRALVR